MKDYKVGYKKPPVEHQIKKGFTKNYAGRPKRSSAAGAQPPAAGEAVSSDPFLREAARKIVARDGDEVREISVLEALARTLAARGLKNDLPASRLFLRWYDKSKATHAVQVEATFKKGFEDKVAQLVTFMFAEMDGLSTNEMTLHPDRIVLRSDGLVEVLPTLEAAQLRRQRIARRRELDEKAKKLQLLIDQKHRTRRCRITQVNPGRASQLITSISSTICRALKTQLNGWQRSGSLQFVGLSTPPKNSRKKS